MHMQGYLCEHRRGVAEILILLGLLPIITMFPTPGNPVYGTAALVVYESFHASCNKH